MARRLFSVINFQPGAMKALIDELPAPDPSKHKKAGNVVFAANSRQTDTTTLLRLLPSEHKALQDLITRNFRGSGPRRRKFCEDLEATAINFNLRSATYSRIFDSVCGQLEFNAASQIENLVFSVSTFILRLLHRRHSSSRSRYIEIDSGIPLENILNDTLLGKHF